MRSTLLIPNYRLSVKKNKKNLKTGALDICRQLVWRLKELLTKELISYGSKICEKKLIVVALARQMCYYNAIKSPKGTANLRGFG